MKNIALNTIFSNWYKDTYGTNKYNQDETVSIFSHISEFKEFLVCEMDMDSSVYTKNISDLLLTDFNKALEEYKDDTPEYFKNDNIKLNEKGEYIINSEDLEESTDEDYNPYQSIVEEVYNMDYTSADGQKILNQLIEANKNNDTNSYKLIDANKALLETNSRPAIAKKNIEMNDILSELIKDEKSIKLIDGNFDNELSQEEIDLFFEEIKNLDGNSEDISLDDILNGIEKLENGDLDFGEKINKTQDETPIKAQENTNTSTPGSSRSSGLSGSSGNYQQNQIQEKSLNLMSKEELEIELETRKASVEEKKESLKNILNGNSSELENLKSTMEAAKEAYETKLEEIKQTDAALVEKVEKAQENTESKEKIVDNYTIKITEQEANISNLANNLNNAQTKIDSLLMTQASLNAVNTSEMTPEQANEIQSKKSALNIAIEKAKRAKEEAQLALDKANEDLSILKSEKENALNELNIAKNELFEAQNELSTQHPEITEVQNSYNNTKEQYETQKANIVSQAQQAILDAQTSVNEVNTAIKNKETKEEIKEYSPNALSEYNEQEGTRIAKAALEYALAGHSTSCGASVRIVLETLGYAGIGKCKGKEWAETNLAHRDDFIEITNDAIIKDYIKETGITPNTTNFNELVKSDANFENYLKNYLPAGTIVCFGQYEYFGYGSGESGHVGIVTNKNGKFVEASGYIREDGINTNMIKHGAEFRAFIPN